MIALWVLVAVDTVAIVVLAFGVWRALRRVSELRSAVAGIIEQNGLLR
jgi:hypothetical protein